MDDEIIENEMSYIIFSLRCHFLKLNHYNPNLSKGKTLITDLTIQNLMAVTNSIDLKKQKVANIIVTTLMLDIFLTFFIKYIKSYLSMKNIFPQ